MLSHGMEDSLKRSTDIITMDQKCMNYGAFMHNVVRPYAGGIFWTLFVLVIISTPEIEFQRVPQSCYY